MVKWTADEISRQDGRHVVVTGANSGIGESTARTLAAAGATVTLACRNLDKARAAAATMTGDVRVAALDLANLESVRSFADSVSGLDVLINNAGVMAVPLARTADGFEMQIGTNHLGHFALTGLLFDRIVDRVVTVSSGAHRGGKIDLDDLNWEHRPYRRWGAYAQAKLANLLFTYELQRRIDAAGSSTRALAAHPGYVNTNLQSQTQSYQDKLMVLGRIIAQSTEMGSLPSLRAATDPQAAGGTYFGPDGRLGLRGHPIPTQSSPASHDQAVAAGLWALSQKLTGVTFP